MTITPERLTRKQAAQYLRDRGFWISYRYLEKLSLPSCGQGPPIDCWWGQRALYRHGDLMAWAEARCRPGANEAA